MAMQTLNPEYDVDWNALILWQYDNSLKLRGLIDNRAGFFRDNVSNLWKDYIANVLNISTANTFGLNFWGRALGVPRPQYEDSLGATVFISDDMYRRLMLARVFLYRSSGTISEFNRYFKFVFPTVFFVLLDGLNMTMTLNIDMSVSDEDFAVMNMPNFFPLPGGVKLIINKVEFDVFSFQGMDLGTLDNEPFISQD